MLIAEVLAAAATFLVVSEVTPAVTPPAHPFYLSLGAHRKRHNGIFARGKLCGFDVGGFEHVMSTVGPVPDTITATELVVEIQRLKQLISAQSYVGDDNSPQHAQVSARYSIAPWAATRENNVKLADLVPTHQKVCCADLVCKTSCLVTVTWSLTVSRLCTTQLDRPTRSAHCCCSTGTGPVDHMPKVTQPVDLSIPGWAAWYITRFLVKLTPKGIVLSVLSQYLASVT